MRLKQGKATYKSKEISKGLSQRPGAFCDRRLRHILEWIKDRFLDK